MLFIETINLKLKKLRKIEYQISSYFSFQFPPGSLTVLIFHFYTIQFLLGFLNFCIRIKFYKSQVICLSLNYHHPCLTFCNFWVKGRSRSCVFLSRIFTYTNVDHFSIGQVSQMLKSAPHGKRSPQVLSNLPWTFKKKAKKSCKDILTQQNKQ